MARSEIIPGEKYNRLTIIEEVEQIGYMRYFKCKCDCGNMWQGKLQSLRSGLTKSCGCLHKETASHTYINNFTKHNNTSKGKWTTEYTTWNCMKNRCYDSKNIRYKHYGGRGIVICDRWLKSFNNFLEDMGPKPTPLHSIDRINVNGNYEPTNCRWSTTKEQNNNKR